jgi:hypothetical protein
LYDQVSGKRNVGICGERRKNGIWHQVASSKQQAAHHTAHCTLQQPASMIKQETAKQPAASTPKNKK